MDYEKRIFLSYFITCSCQGLFVMVICIRTEISRCYDLKTPTLGSCQFFCVQMFAHAQDQIQFGKKKQKCQNNLKVKIFLSCLKRPPPPLSTLSALYTGFSFRGRVKVKAPSIRSSPGLCLIIITVNVI